jgi:hypothetical protein
MISSILFTIASSSLVSSFSSIGTGSFVTSSYVIPVVASSTKESPGRVLIVDLSNETSVIHSYLSSRAVSISWFKSAHIIGYEQLPCPMPYNSFSTVLMYDMSDTPKPVLIICSNCSQSFPSVFTEF